MARVNEEKIIIEKYRKLPPNKKQELLGFLESLESGETVRDWMEFDAWALNLAREKGFAQLTEADIASIVSDLRSGR